MGLKQSNPQVHDVLTLFCTMLHKVCQLVKKKIFAMNFPLCKKGYLFVYIWLVFILDIYRIWMEAQLYERYIFNLMLLLMMILMMIKMMMMMLREREERVAHCFKFVVCYYDHNLMISEFHKIYNCTDEIQWILIW